MGSAGSVKFEFFLTLMGEKDYKCSGGASTTITPARYINSDYMR